MPKRTHWTFFLATPSLFYLHPSWADEQQGQLAQIERIVVSATRTEKRQLEVPAAITVQSFDVLRQKGLTYSTDEFRGVPGVFFLRGEDTPSISIRGATGNHGNDPFFSGACDFRFYDILIDYSTGKIINDRADNACFVREQLRTAADTTNQFYGLFIQDEIDLTDQLSLTLGARFDAFERDIDFTVIGAQPVDQSASGSANAISPKASLAYQQDNSLLYLSYGRGFNSNFGPVFQWDPNRYARDEAPTTIDNYELGWKGQALDRNLSWETALFYFEQKDRRIFIDNPNPAGPPTLATTGQKYTSHGLEASVSYRPTPATQLLFNYTYLAPKWDELIIAGSFGEPDSDYTNHTPQGVPEHIFYSEVSHQFSQWLQARLSYEWYGNYFVDLSNQVRTGQHQLVNLSATFTPLEDDKLTVDLSITNLLDEEYFYYFAASRTAATNATPGTPRQLRLGIRMTF